LKISEVGIDLGICLALYSAKTGLVLEPLTATFGEVSLSGEIRQVAQEERRRKATADLGFKHLVCPNKKEKETDESETLETRRAGTIQDAVKAAFVR
jgi:DNA repair protein RadA/Sms